MYTDIIHYQLAEGVTKKQLLEAAQAVLDSWMSKQEGFISWQINSLPDEGFVDIVRWENEAAAKKAEESMQEDLDLGNTWFACYDVKSISSDKATEVKHFDR